MQERRPNTQPRRLVVETASLEETIRVGRALGSLLAPGDVVALDGELGAGKTVLVRGIAAGLGAGAAVRSPTFTIVHRYEGGRVPLVHVDAYRLRGAAELEDLGLEEVLDPVAAIAVEWASRVAAALPREVLHLRLEHTGETCRRISFEASGGRAASIVAALDAAFRASLGIAGMERWRRPANDST